MAIYRQLRTGVTVLSTVRLCGWIESGIYSQVDGVWDGNWEVQPRGPISADPISHP